jgi:hypothetical protein
MDVVPVTIVEGTTSPLIFQLLEQGLIVGDLTGVTVTLLLTDRLGAAVSTAGKTATVSAADSTVSYTPGASDINGNLSPYRARWKLTDAQGHVSYVPNDSRDVWTVVTE